jgi:hypothetical protein
MCMGGKSHAQSVPSTRRVSLNGRHAREAHEAAHGAARGALSGARHESPRVSA